MGITPPMPIPPRPMPMPPIPIPPILNMTLIMLGSPIMSGSHLIILAPPPIPLTMARGVAILLTSTPSREEIMMAPMGFCMMAGLRISMVMTGNDMAEGSAMANCISSIVAMGLGAPMPPAPIPEPRGPEPNPPSS